MPKFVLIKRRTLHGLGGKVIEQPIKLVEGDVWVMVRRADARGSAPFVISRKEWENLPTKDALKPEDAADPEDEAYAS